jgi:methanethiol S-methyltransferase
VYTARQRGIAILYGLACHVSAVGIAAMLAGLYLGLAPGRGGLRGPAAWPADALLLAGFAALHSFLLGQRGRRLLVRLAPLGLGADLACITFAWIGSLQILLVFAAWSPLGPAWWEPHGALRIGWSVAYAAAWLFLLRAMSDAGLAHQTGFLGWAAVARGRKPDFGRFPTRGCFRFVRQPVYLAFALTAVDRARLDARPPAGGGRLDGLLRAGPAAQGTARPAAVRRRVPALP